MSEENAVLQPEASAITSLARKSWTAYVGTILLGLFLLMIVVPVAWRASVGVGAVVLTAVVAFLAYRVASLRSYHLYYDETGVWLYRGVLPWNKGTAGVKWRDIDEAVFFQGLWSWVFKSYTVRIGHRFTKSSELLLSHMARGHVAVENVNGAHQELLRTDQLR